MFPGIQSIHEICPGLILRCDCLSIEMDKTILSPEEWHARWASGTRPTADPKPCLVIEVDYDTEFVKVARLCDAAPRDCRKWVRIDSAPEIEWCHPYSWIWVASPATMRLVKNRSRIMHINQDPRFNQDPISSRNLRHYLVHRENYESWRRFQDPVVARAIAVQRSIRDKPRAVHHAPRAARRGSRRIYGTAPDASRAVPKSGDRVVLECGTRVDTSQMT
ncbi:unnamed protein product [Mycena citricolor]|uniref:Uncharacterized protein n=1 Tax=Mycena citricolor TaxID=2018698 RepID=A0AAD2HP22_9AGAR|nr:unnamed protein product [Mycena citricolor]